MERQKHSCLFIVETIQLKFTNKDLFCIGCNYKYD